MTDQQQEQTRILAEIREGQKESLELQRRQFEMAEAQFQRAERLHDKAEQIQDRSAQIIGAGRKLFIVIVPVIGILIVYLTWLLFQ